MIFGDPVLPARYWSKVQVVGSGCWEWTAATLNTGYGCIRVSGKTRTAHRWMCSVAHGEPAPGQVTLHSCDNRRCVNPTHLRWGTQADNLRESWQRGNMRDSRKRSQCPRGHEYTQENTYQTKQGTSACRICYRAHWRAWNERRKGTVNDSTDKE